MKKREKSNGTSLRKSLCQYIESSTGCLDQSATRLSLVGGDLHLLDKIPSSISESVQRLYLSDNCLKDTVGVEQFSNLRFLSLANNFIKFFLDLKSLTSLQQLEKLLLVGNKVTELPFYRQYVLNLCPKLTVLDGTPITLSERQSSRLNMIRVTSFYDQMRMNELQNTVLSHLRHQIVLHREFRKVVMGQFRCVMNSSIVLLYCDIGV